MSLKKRSEVWVNADGSLSKRDGERRKLKLLSVAKRRSIELSDIVSFRELDRDTQAIVMSALREDRSRRSPKGLGHAFAVLGPTAALATVLIGYLIPSADPIRYDEQEHALQMARLAQAADAARAILRNMSGESGQPIEALDTNTAFFGPYEQLGTGIEMLTWIIAALGAAVLTSVLLSLFHFTPAAARMDAWIATFEDVQREVPPRRSRWWKL
ncbi:hypothetical protein ACX80U_05720 [Arthrobacter sp. TmT3-37]